MFKTILVTGVLFLTATSQAEQVIARCRGSLIDDKSTGEMYTLKLSGDRLFVESQYYDGFSFALTANQQTVLSDTENRLHVVEKKKRWGMTMTKRTVLVDFQTGKGKASEYIAFESLLRARTVYLNHCTR